jgi:hypothetical protein
LLCVGSRNLLLEVLSDQRSIASFKTANATCRSAVRGIFQAIGDFIREHPLFVAVSVVGAGLLVAGLTCVIKSLIKLFSPKVQTVGAERFAHWNSDEKIAMSELFKIFKPSDFRSLAPTATGDGYAWHYCVTPETVLSNLVSRGVVSVDEYAKTSAASDVVAMYEDQSNEPCPKFSHMARRGKLNIAVECIEGVDHSHQTSLDISHIVAQGSYHISLGAPCTRTKLGSVTFVAGRRAMMPYHFYARITSHHKSHPSGTLDLAPVVGGLPFSFPISHFVSAGANSLRIGDRDLMFITFPDSMPERSNLLKHFITRADLTKLEKTVIRLESYSPATDNAPLICRHRIARACARKSVLTQSGYTTSVYEYPIPTKTGECGDVFYVDNLPAACNRVILGFHIAGSDVLANGIGVSVAYEDVVEGLGKVEYVSQSGAIPYFARPSCATPVDASSFVGVGESSISVHLSKKSSLVKTPLHNSWSIDTSLPAACTPIHKPDGSYIYPYVKGIAEYGSSVIHVDPTHLQRVADVVFAPILQHSTACPRALLSYEEAVAGVPLWGIKGIPRSTSPGHPFVLEGVRNKNHFFGHDGLPDFTRPASIELRSRVMSVLEDASHNRRQPHVYVDFLKDELRPAEKVAEGSTRIISAAGLTYVVAWRMMFGCFTQSIVRNRIKNGIAIGINYYSEWGLLADHLKQKGPHVIAGDFRKYDAHELPQLLNIVLNLINRWYDDGPENARVRRVLWLEVTNSLHLGGVGSAHNTLYEWLKGLPSGHPATSIINSLYNLLLFGLAWNDIMGPQHMEAFYDYVAIATYGDDNVVNIAEQVIAVFNQHTVTAIMPVYGQEYTSEAKDLSVVPISRPLSQVTFLKRMFREFPEGCDPPLELEVVLTMPYWCKSALAVDSIVLTNLETALMELSLHGDEVFDRWYPIMARAARERLNYAVLYSTRLGYAAKAKLIENLPWV